MPALASLLSLVLPAREGAPRDGGAAAATAFRPAALPTVAVPSLCADTFLTAAFRVDFAFSTMLVRMLDAPPAVMGAVGLMGEMGRARKDFWGERGRIGDRGRVRELAERGERTDGEGGILDVVDFAMGIVGSALTLFLGTSTPWFSLSVDMSSLYVLVGKA